MKFKESPLVKNHKILTGTKRDMRKKVVKSTTPTSDLKKPTTLKRQLGGNIFTTYNSITPYEGPVFEQPVATVEIEELPINRLEANRQNVMAKAEEKKEEPVVEEKVNTEPLPTSKEETPIVESKESTPINIKSKDEFIKTMTPAFENALKAKGLDTKYAKYLVAQSALESNWGKSQSGKFNFGGIKGKETIRKTREVINGKSIHVNDSFRDFKDINDYANYHVSLLNNKRYQAFSGGDFIDRVVKGGYATDPNYKRALSNVYNQIAKAQVGMKIPKLQNAGELKARILRRFRQEKLDAHNEELIGFDWSRYKSNKPKPETTPTQSEQLENGGVIKYQNPSSGIKYMGGYDKRGNMVLPVNNENGMNNVTLPEVTVTPRNINLAGAVDRGRRVAGNIGKEILSATTPLGDIESAKDIYQDTTSGNYRQAALGAGLLLLPNFIEKPLKELKKVIGKTNKALLRSKLPKYAKPNWQGDNLELIKERLKSGGFDRLERHRSKIVEDFPEYKREIILNSEPQIINSPDPTSSNPAGAVYNDYYALYKDKIDKYTPQQQKIILGHEFDHYVFSPTDNPEITEGLSPYFTRNNGREQSARGTQIKDYFGLNKGNQDITPEMWEYAKKYYTEDTGINNSMSSFFNSIDNSKLKQYLKWLNNNSAVVAAPILINYGNNKQD